ncbi:MAG: thioredoxin family protein [Synechococcales bacterium]|nr:thioredoxin family protein [Synechococcales bacterium]
MSSLRIISDAEFDAEVLQAEQPVMVYFWASWCGPCRLMAPLVEKIADSYVDHIKVVKMEVDPNPNSVGQCHVEGVPAFRFFQKGELCGQSEGAIPASKLEELVKTHLLA